MVLAGGGSGGVALAERTDPYSVAAAVVPALTGIGGGVAIMALLFAVAAGANVYVSSGSQEKIDRAKSMGAKGGINYKEKGWEKTLKELLPSDRKQLDAIIDGAGGDVVDKGAKLLKVRSPSINVAVASVY